MKTAGDLLTSSAGCWGRVKEKMDDRFVSFFEFLFFFCCYRALRPFSPSVLVKFA